MYVRIKRFCAVNVYLSGTGHTSRNFQLAITMGMLLVNKDVVLFSLLQSVFAVCYVAPFCHKEMQRFNHDIDFTLKFKL